MISHARQIYLLGCALPTSWGSQEILKLVSKPHLCKGDGTENLRNMLYHVALAVGRSRQRRILVLRRRYKSKRGSTAS